MLRCVFLLTDDEVYMSNVQDLDEYILNDAGVLYRGNTYAVGPKKWNFGQVNTAHFALLFRRMFTWRISRSSQCSTTGVTKAVVCVILSCLWDGAYKRTLAVNRKE